MNETYMKRAIALAKFGEGAVNPNPLVGAVIVKDNRIIGEGYHRRYGELHAERDAFAHLTEDATGAEMYVTLEPCCHHGKQPPCVEAIIEHGIKRVYVGSDDPNELVSGKGYETLRKAGIEVVTGVLKDECDALNRVFFHYIVKKTPYVAMKYAMTMDGKIACYTGESKWVTGEAARADVQRLRNKYMAIMVGVQTVLADDPMLTCRMEGGRNPVRIICDSKLRTPLNSNIVKTAKEVRTIIACVNIAEDAKKQNLLNSGIEILETSPDDDGHVDVSEMLIRLGEMGIDSILLEGGGTLNYSFLNAGKVNEVITYIAPKIFGGDGTFTPVKGVGVANPDIAHTFALEDVTSIGEDIRLTYIKSN